MANKENLSVVLHGKDDLRIEPRPVAPPVNGEVQLAIQTVGICGTDIHFWKHGEAGGLVPNAPVVLGHESSGVVTALGEGVTHLQVGDRVTIEPIVPCHTCQDCKEGRYNLCKKLRFFAVPPYQGSLCRRLNYSAHYCYKIPDHVSFEEAALMEPLSVAIHGCRRAGVTMADHVLICGAGAIGLMTLLTARACGAAKVAITDINESRLAKAKELGADYIIKVESKDGKEVAKKVIEVMGSVDKTVECTGVESSIHAALYATKTGGTVSIIGIGENVIQIPIVEAIMREVDVKGVFCFRNCYPAALAMVASGSINVKPLITHHFKLEDSLQAFETSRTQAGGAIKVVIHCNE